LSSPGFWCPICDVAGLPVDGHGGRQLPAVRLDGRPGHVRLEDRLELGRDMMQFDLGLNDGSTPTFLVEFKK
jgi:hypothetical protein